MNTLSNKQQAVNSIVSGTSSVLGAIHAAATTVADLSLKAELQLNAKYHTKDDGSKLTSEELISIAESRITNTREFQYKIGAKKRTIIDLEVEDQE